MVISPGFFDPLKSAFVLTLFYFLCTLLFEPWSHRIAQKISTIKPVYYVLKISSFFLMTLMTIALLFYAFGNQDLSQTFGLTKAFKRGKVVLRIPAPDMSAGIILLKPRLIEMNGRDAGRYVLSFDFQIHKGIKDKEIDLNGGRFIIESIVNERVVDQTQIPVGDQFRISDHDLSGTYVSPQPFSLNAKPDSIDLIWEMNSRAGDIISSKPYHIKLQSAGL